ncbi:hypothetical protein QG034_04375 [Kingella kingae]|nr:hypothetical protein [Kingella kingae]MDK4526150.1 hypothetical protein [Kingella kingae]MDK4532180.1 hypothetical protein [Kingella kingae]
MLVTIDDDDMNYFQNLAQEMGVSYQTLIHSFLHECAVQHRKPLLSK